MARAHTALALAVLAISADAAGFCRSDECRESEATKAATLCSAKPGGASAWVDDPFQPSVKGVAFYDDFSLEALTRRFGAPTSESSWRGSYPNREPTDPNRYYQVEFKRYEFRGVTIETATTLQGDVPHVTLIEVASSEVPLKCRIKIGMPVREVAKRLALPPAKPRTQATPRHCPVYYDLYDLPGEEANGTLCLYPDERGLLRRVIWDKTRWASGYH